MVRSTSHGMATTSPESADIRASYEHARQAWPRLDVTFETFADRVHQAGTNHASDLYLACACANGDSDALVEFDRLFVGWVREVVVRIDSSHDFLSEVQQILRERLLVGPTAKIRDYRGGGALASWVRTAAIRTALNLRRRLHRDNAPIAEPVEQLYEPETALLRQRYSAEIDGALRAAIGTLQARDRLLLQLYYVDGLTLAKIAALERVGTSTVFRRLASATQSVLATMKGSLEEKLALSSGSLDSLIRHVQDDIDLSLSQIMG